jgi:hypothetical protein
MEVSGQLHAPAASHLGKECPVSIRQEAGCAPEPVWALWSREKSLTLPGIEPQPSVAELTELCTCNFKRDAREMNIPVQKYIAGWYQRTEGTDIIHYGSFKEVRDMIRQIH